MAAVTVTTGVHFNRNTTPELDITAMDDDRWMVGISDDCTIFGTAGQLRSVAQQILDAIPAPVQRSILCPLCDGAACEEGCGECDMSPGTAGPDAHRQCARCNGSGVALVSEEVDA